MRWPRGSQGAGGTQPLHALGRERQRALLAAALAQGTDILFLDEPTSFLDYRQQVEMMALVRASTGTA